MEIKNKEQVVTEVARYELELLKDELARKEKHVIKTSTLKERIMLHVPAKVDDTDLQYLIDTGLVQVVQSVLHADGWRSVADGYFALLNECEDLSRLKIMVRNADTRVIMAEGVAGEVRQVEARQMAFVGIDCEELIEEPCYEDYIADLEADAI